MSQSLCERLAHGFSFSWRYLLCQIPKRQPLLRLAQQVHWTVRWLENYHRGKCRVAPHGIAPLFHWLKSRLLTGVPFSAAFGSEVTAGTIFDAVGSILYVAGRVSDTVGTTFYAVVSIAGAAGMSPDMVGRVFDIV